MSPRKAFPWLVLTFLASSSQAQVAVNRPTTHEAAAAPLLADGFDFPVGKPDAAGYYKARGFSLGNHPGEDWDGIGGGNSDLGDTVASIGDGVVVCARDAHSGWGNVVIVRHQFFERGRVQTIDALFAHLDTVLVWSGETVARGQRIGTVGTAHGLYPAHLHFEIRKNLDIGVNRAAFPCDFSCYYDPTKFINARRHLGASQSGTDGLFACARALHLPSPENSLTTQADVADNVPRPTTNRGAPVLR